MGEGVVGDADPQRVGGRVGATDSGPAGEGRADAEPWEEDVVGGDARPCGAGGGLGSCATWRGVRARARRGRPIPAAAHGGVATPLPGSRRRGGRGAAGTLPEGRLRHGAQGPQPQADQDGARRLRHRSRSVVLRHAPCDPLSGGRAARAADARTAQPADADALHAADDHHAVRASPAVAARLLADGVGPTCAVERDPACRARGDGPTGTRGGGMREGGDVSGPSDPRRTTGRAGRPGRRDGADASGGRRAVAQEGRGDGSGR